MSLIIASSNKHKIAEFAKLLAPYKVEGFANINELKIVENGKTFEENALIKARAVAKACPEKSFVLADDSGLCVDALGGKPGIHSARFSSIMSDEANTAKLIACLKELNLLRSNAHFYCALALVCKYGEFVSTGLVHGFVSVHSSGQNGFGYDPIFTPNGFTKTFASLEAKEKAKISHRFKAACKMKQKLEDLGV